MPPQHSYSCTATVVCSNFLRRHSKQSPRVYRKKTYLENKPLEIASEQLSLHCYLRSLFPGAFSNCTELVTHEIAAVTLYFAFQDGTISRQAPLEIHHKNVRKHP